jgi:hypothetical protein
MGLEQYDNHTVQLTGLLLVLFRGDHYAFNTLYQQHSMEVLDLLHTERDSFRQSALSLGQR